MSCLFEPIHGRFPIHSICDSYPDCIGCSYLDSSKQPKQTNADRIRNMTDEELAEWFDQNFACRRHEGCLAEKCCNDTITCRQAWLKWLKQEVSDA